MSPLARVALAALALSASLLISVLLLSLAFGSLISALYATFIIAPPFLPVGSLSLYWVYHLPRRPESIPPSHYRASITYGVIIGVSILPYLAAIFWVHDGSNLPAILALIAYAGLNLWAALILSRSWVLTYLVPHAGVDGVERGRFEGSSRNRRFHLAWLVVVPMWGTIILYLRGHEVAAVVLLLVATIALVLLWREIIALARRDRDA